MVFYILEFCNLGRLSYAAEVGFAVEGIESV